MNYNTRVCLAGFGTAVSVLVIAECIDNIIGWENYWDYAFFVVVAAWVGITVWIRKLLMGK